MKSGPEIVKAVLRQFFESAADDIEKMVENLKLGKVSSRNQVRDAAILRCFYMLTFLVSWYLYVCLCSCRLRVCPRTSTTPPTPCCQSSPHCSTISPSSSSEMTSCVSEALLSVEPFMFSWLSDTKIFQCLSPLSTLSGRLADILLSFNVQYLLSGHSEDSTCRKVSTDLRIYFKKLHLYGIWLSS